MKIGLSHETVDTLKIYMICSVVFVCVAGPLLANRIGFNNLSLANSSLLFLCAALMSVVIYNIRTPQRPKARVKTYISTQVAFWLFILILFAEIVNLFDVLIGYNASITRQELWIAKNLSGIEGRGLESFLFELISPFQFFLIWRLSQVNSQSNNRLPLFLLFSNFIIDGVTLYYSSLHRSPFIFLLLNNLFFYSLVIKPIRVKIFHALVGAIFCAFFLSWSAHQRAGQSGEISLSHGLRGLMTASEIQALDDDIRDHGTYEYGKQIFYNLISWVPRSIWIDKPIVSFSYRKSVELYGPVNERFFVRTFTVPGEGFAQFGALGAIFWSLLLVLFYRAIFRFLYFGSPMVPFLLPIIVQFPLILRADLSSLFFRFYPILFLILFLYVFYQLARQGGLNR